MKKETFRDIADSVLAVPMEDERIDRLFATVNRANDAVRKAAEKLPIGAQPSDFFALLESERTRRS